MLTEFETYEGFTVTLVFTSMFWGVLVFNIYVNSPETKYSTTTQNILSLRDTNPNILGSFFLGTGHINTTQQYSMFIKNSDTSLSKYYVPTSTRIYQGNHTPRHEKTTCENGKDFNWFLGLPVTGQECEFKELHKLYVPKDTVILDFSVQ